MTRPRCRIPSVALIATLTLLLTAALLPTTGNVPAASAPIALVAAAPGDERWSADLTIVDRDDVNVRRTAAGLRLREARPTWRGARSPH
ncbi:hypothetical protein KBX53_35440, partial [Micromonospora sp. M51]|nr:hypothetical protein [Micromonospora sp. M51]